MITHIDASQIIQFSLTPVIMILSSAVFLLGLQNRFSNIFSRFRALSQEQKALERSSAVNEKDKRHLQSVTLQLEKLYRRVLHIKNAMVSFYVGIFCFMGTSLCLFMAPYTPFPLINLGVAGFFAGMICILTAILLLMSEISMAFRVLKLEHPVSNP